MKYVLAHAALTGVSLWAGATITWLMLVNVTDTTPYGFALLGLMMIVLAWIPFGVTLNETVGEYKALQRRRRRLAAAKRRHPSRVR